MVLGLIIGIIYLFCDIFYWAKWVASIIALRLRKKTERRRFDLYDFESIDEPEKLGLLIPKEEKAFESPFPEEHLQDAADEIFIYGVNSKSEALLVRITRACNDESEAWVYLKLSDGRWYELEQTAGYQRNFGGKCMSFTCGGLQMYYLAPMRRWRIVYCGMLRERKSDNKMESKSIFVKFTFIWTASSEIFDATSDLDIKATAVAMARAKWNSPFPPVDKISKGLDFYAQSGVMTGIVSIEDEPDKELYLFGERMRYIGNSEYLVGCKFKHILGVVPESGLVLHLGKVSNPSAFHNLYFGFIVHPNGHLYSIEDGHIISNLTRNNAEGENLTAMIKAGGEQYELRGNFVGDGVWFMSEQGWNGHLDLTRTEFEVDGLKGSGFMITGEVSKLLQRKIQKVLSLSSSTKPLTVYFTDETSHLTELTGGKGSSLGKLTKLSNEMECEFTVPKGIIVTTAAYEQFLSCDTIEKIDILKNIAYGNVKGSIHEACKMVALAIERSSLPDKIVKEIEEKLNKLFDGNINQYKVAVRSSATGEDTDQMSAAGQMDTFLGVQGLKEILTAVKKCWASQFGYIATEYKRQNGQILNSPMAVVIQEMVECEAAGVLFTCDPVTNNPSVTVISGNYGLGESVVSGSEEPDTVVLEKLQNEEVKVKSVMVGMKQHRIVLTDMRTSEEKDGTVTEEVPEEEKNKCCISEEMAVKLGKLSLKIENYFKSPRDIEWGIKDKSVYILQSRPITTGGAISDYEIKHEFDAPLRCEIEFFTKSNIGEVMPGAASPLGIDAIHKYFSVVFQKLSLREKQGNDFLKTKYFPSGVTPFCNHMMMTVADLLTRMGDLDSINSQSMMIGIFGRLLDDPELKVVVKHKKVKPVNKTIFYPTLIKNLFFAGYGIENVKEKTFKYQITAEKGKTSKEIFNLQMHSSNHLVEPFFQHMTCTEMSSLWNMYMFTILAKAKGCIDNEVYSDFAKLLASSSNVESADVPAAMQNLAHCIVKDIKADTFKAMPIEEAQKWLETSTNLAGFKYRQFMKRHGHRCLKEFDMHSIPWSVDPKPLIKLLQNMAGSCADAKEKEEASFSNIFPHLNISLNLKSKLLVKFLLPNCRRGVREREACKSILIKSMDNIRKGFQHLSKAMVAEGYLPDTDLMYFLTIDEINDLLESRNPRFIARANHRRKLFPTLDSYIFEELMKGRPVPINEKLNDEEIEYVADLTVKGIPVSQGTVKGYARVALNLEEASHLKPGEILITYSTDIGWSPYFPILGGVVTELGGLISHGAVVSREYGLPCVVGLHGATRQFVTGDYVLLDGNKGILQRISAPES